MPRGRGEMAYAAGLGPVGGNTVGVQIPPPALFPAGILRQLAGATLGMRYSAAATYLAPLAVNSPRVIACTSTR
jgi:hypothetical protein